MRSGVRLSPSANLKKGWPAGPALLPLKFVLLHDINMSENRAIWSLRLPLLAALADLAWAFNALQSAPAANGADSVGMINAVVWIFLHLPAAYREACPFKACQPGAGAFPPGQLLLIGALGILQMAAIAWAIGLWLDKKRIMIFLVDYFRIARPALVHGDLCRVVHAGHGHLPGRCRLWRA